jgi:PadR family transcriptional regulator AphA
MRTRTPAQTLTNTQAAILGLLSRREASGYDLLKDMERHLAHIFSPARSQVYAVLPRLVGAGLATRREVPQSDRPDKWVYRITRAGRDSLAAWVAEPPAEEETRSLFLLKLFLAEHVDETAVAPLIEERRAQSQERLAGLRALEREADAGEDSFHGLLTLRWGLEYHRAVVRWADAALRELER